MTAEKIKNRLDEMASHLTFRYKGKEGGIDPINRTHFDMWYGSTGTIARSLDDVMKTPLFDGKNLDQIAAEIIVIDW